MYVSKERKLIFLAAPRAASRSVTRFLCENDSFIRVGDHHSISNIPLWKQKDYTVFCIVRNHFDTWASWFAAAYPYTHNSNASNMRKALLPFIKRKIHEERNWMLPQSLWGRYTSVSDFIFRYEFLRTDLYMFFKQTVNLPHIGKSKRLRTYEYFNAETDRWISDNYDDEIEELKERKAKTQMQLIHPIHNNLRQAQ